MKDVIAIIFLIAIIMAIVNLVTGCVSCPSADEMRQMRNDIDLVESDLSRLESNVQDLSRGYRIVPIRVTITNACDDAF